MLSPDSFEEFVVRRTPALLRTAYLLTGDHHAAEDLLQAALIKSAAVWPRIEDDPGPYVRKILVHENISWWRRRRWREHPTAEVPDVVVTADEDVSSRLALRRALGGLPRRQRTVMVLRYYDDLTERETAEAMGTSIGTVKSQAREALARLRLLLPDEPRATAVIARVQG